MVEHELVVDALKLAKTAINEHSDNMGVIVEAIGVLKFLVDHVKEEQHKDTLMSVTKDLMLYVILGM